MRNCIARLVAGVVLLMACLISGAWAQDSMVLTSTPSNATMGGVFTSPYGITINNASTPTLLICDDFVTDISYGTAWSANVTTPPLAQVTNSNVTGLKFDSSPYSANIVGGSTNAAQDYATAAVLAAELLALPNIGTPSEDSETAGELSYALWGVFDAPLLTSANTGWGTLTTVGTNPSTGQTGGELGAAKSDLAAAQALVAAVTTVTGTNVSVNLNAISVDGHSIASLTVYTPSAPNGLASSQEFLQVSMPEPSSPALLAIDLLAAVGLIVAFRRRIFIKAS